MSSSARAMPVLTVTGRWGQPSQSRLTPCQLPIGGAKFFALSLRGAQQGRMSSSARTMPVLTVTGRWGQPSQSRLTPCQLPHRGSQVLCPVIARSAVGADVLIRPDDACFDGHGPLGTAAPTDEIRHIP